MPDEAPQPDEETVRQKMTDLIKSTIRTFTPFAVAYILGWLKKIGIDADEGTVSLAFTFGIGSLWYSAGRVLEQKWPKLGWLLGYPTQPAYGKKA